MFCLEFRYILINTTHSTLYIFIFYFIHYYDKGLYGILNTCIKYLHDFKLLITVYLAHKINVKLH